MSSSSSSVTKKKKTEPTSFPTLPDDLVISCFSRVSRLYHPTLSLVSKSFRSLIASPELYKTRSLLNIKESCLYVCLQYPPDPIPRWFTLCLKPNKKTPTTSKKEKKKKKKSSCYVLSTVSTLNSPIVEWSSLVSVGHNLYAICGGAIGEAPCSNVSFLDCTTHTWHQAPSLRIAHNAKFDGKMYLPGPSENPDSLNCIEVFDSKTQTWKPVPPEKRVWKPEEMLGKIFMVYGEPSGDRKGMALNLKDSTADVVVVSKDTSRFSFCVIESITYGFNPRCGFYWSALDGDDFGVLKGLEELPKFAGYSSVKLVNYGGKMLVLWDKYVPSSKYKEKMIWCAEISLEERRRPHSINEVWGKVEWFGAVLTVPKSYEFVYAIAATV